MHFVFTTKDKHQITTTTNNNKSAQQKNHQDQKKKKKKSTTHNNNKLPNTHHKSPILDRTDEGEGGTVAEPARFGQNPKRSH